VPIPAPTSVPIPAPSPVPSAAPSNLPSPVPTTPSPSLLPTITSVPTPQPTPVPTGYCEPGTYFTGTACLACQTGTFSEATGQQISACTVCPEGKYQNATGQSSCTLCPSGRFLEDDGLNRTKHDKTSSCMACESGKYSSSDRASCSDCPAGTQPADGGCESCEAGTYSATGVSCLDCGLGDATGTSSGASTCSPCSAGKHSAEKRVVNCTSCEQGKFADSRAVNCTKCETGKFANTVEMSSCESCDSGKYSDQLGASACKSCEPGTFSGTRADECTACTTGRFAAFNDSTSCDACAAGKYSAQVASSRCSECETGKYISISGSSTCIVCSPGTYAENEGTSSSCTNCELGRFAENNASSTCDDCTAGKYTALTGSASCENCPEGKFNDEVGNKEGCLRCDDPSADYGQQYTSVEGATECNMCREMYYWHPRNLRDTAAYGTCEPCESGMICDETGTVLTSLAIDRGYYRFGNWSTEIYLCSNDNCLGGIYGQRHTRKGNDIDSVTGLTTEDAQCREGSMGPLCDLCQSGYTYNSVTERCDECHSLTKTELVLYPLVLVAIISTVVVVDRFFSHRMTVVSRWFQECVTFNRLHMFKRIDILVPRVQILWTAYQIMAATSSTLPEVQYPPQFENMRNIIGTFTTIDFGAIGLNCVYYGYNVYSHLLVTTVGPLLVTVLGALVTSIVHERHKKAEIAGMRLSLEEAKESDSKAFANYAYFVLCLAYLMLPVTSTAIADTLRGCRRYDDGTGTNSDVAYYFADLSEECSGPKYRFYQTFGYVMIFSPIGGPVGCPLMFGALLAWNKKAISDPTGKDLPTKLQNRNNDKKLKPLMFLFSAYVPQRWWYDSYDCIRRVSLTALLVLIEIPQQRLTVAVYLSFLFVLVHCTSRPYSNHRTNGLALGAHVLIFTVFFSGQQLLVGVWDGEDSSLGSALVTGILLVTCVLVYLQITESKETAQAELNMHERDIQAQEMRQQIESMMVAQDLLRHTIQGQKGRSRQTSTRSVRNPLTDDEHSAMVEGMGATYVDDGGLIDSDDDEIEPKSSSMLRFEEKEEDLRQGELRRIRLDLAYRTSAVSFGKTEYPCYVMAVSTLKGLDYLPDHEEALRLGLLQVLKKGGQVPNSASSYFIAHNWEGADGETADNKEGTKLLFLQNFHANLAISASREIWVWFDFFSIPSHPGRRQRLLSTGATSTSGSSAPSSAVANMQSAFAAANESASDSPVRANADDLASPRGSPSGSADRAGGGGGVYVTDGTEASEKQHKRRLAAIRSIPAYSQLCSRLLPMIRKKEVWSALYPQPLDDDSIQPSERMSAETIASRPTASDAAGVETSAVDAPVSGTADPVADDSPVDESPSASTAFATSNRTPPERSSSDVDRDLMDSIDEPDSHPSDLIHSQEYVERIGPSAPRGTEANFWARGWCRLEVLSALCPKRFSDSEWRPGPLGLRMCYHHDPLNKHGHGGPQSMGDPLTVHNSLRDPLGDDAEYTCCTLARGHPHECDRVHVAAMMEFCILPQFRDYIDSGSNAWDLTLDMRNLPLWLRHQIAGSTYGKAGLTSFVARPSHYTLASFRRAPSMHVGRTTSVGSPGRDAPRTRSGDSSAGGSAKAAAGNSGGGGGRSHYGHYGMPMSANSLKRPKSAGSMPVRGAATHEHGNSRLHIHQPHSGTGTSRARGLSLPSNGSASSMNSDPDDIELGNLGSRVEESGEADSGGSGGSTRSSKGFRNTATTAAPSARSGVYRDDDFFAERSTGKSNTPTGRRVVRTTILDFREAVRVRFANTVRARGDSNRASEDTSMQRRAGFDPSKGGAYVSNRSRRSSTSTSVPESDLERMRGVSNVSARLSDSNMGAADAGVGFTDNPMNRFPESVGDGASELDPDAWRTRTDTNNSDTRSKRLAARRATGPMQNFGNLRRSVFGGWDKDGNRLPTTQGGRGVRFGDLGGEGGGGEPEEDGGGGTSNDDGVQWDDSSAYPQRDSGVGDFGEFSMPSRLASGGGGSGGGGQRPSSRNSNMSWRNRGVRSPSSVPSAREWRSSIRPAAVSNASTGISSLGMGSVGGGTVRLDGGAERSRSRSPSPVPTAQAVRDRKSRGAEEPRITLGPEEQHEF